MRFHASLTILTALLGAMMFAACGTSTSDTAVSSGNGDAATDASAGGGEPDAGGSGGSSGAGGMAGVAGSAGGDAGGSGGSSGAGGMAGVAGSAGGDAGAGGVGGSAGAAGKAGGAGEGGMAGVGGAGGAGQDVGLPYPTRDAYHIKGLQPDFWPNHDEIQGNGVGAVAMNLVWVQWEATKKAPPCDGGSEQEYDGHCFRVVGNVDASIKDYSQRGLAITAIVYGVPAWARTGHPCSPVTSGFEMFCSPDDAADYGRFAAMLAQRYDGQHGHGRIADFVIHNEVNANDWFDIGCGQGTPCDTKAWLDTYANNYIAAYDGIKKSQTHAKVLVSLEHHFGKSFDNPAANNPLLSGMTFLEGLAARVGARHWQVAFHPYPPNLLAPQFGPDDFPKVTYGNIGVLAGWLRDHFPQTPSCWDIELTESGVNSLSPSSQQAQADGVCQAFRNVLGTPGISNYIYHRMLDHPTETAAGLGLGLFDVNRKAKLAWSVFASANRNDLNPPKLSCGFEELPYTRLRRGYKAGVGHWATSRQLPDGYKQEQSWRLYRDPGPGRVILYECRQNASSWISQDVHCGGQLNMGPVGYALKGAKVGWIKLYACRVGSGPDRFVSPSSTCENQTVEGTLGYVFP